MEQPKIRTKIVQVLYYRMTTEGRDLGKEVVAEIEVSASADDPKDILYTPINGDLNLCWWIIPQIKEWVNANGYTFDDFESHPIDKIYTPYSHWMYPV